MAVLEIFACINFLKTIKKGKIVNAESKHKALSQLYFIKIKLGK